MYRRVIFGLSALVLAACSTIPLEEEGARKQSHSQVLIVCAERTIANGNCDFYGQNAIQEAVDAAQSGTTIRIRPGIYRPLAYRDIPFQDLLIRGFTVIENKDLALLGEGEVILDGSLGAASAFVTKNSRVRFANMHLRDFRWGIKEDDTYDGHGIFVIGGQVTIENVAMRKIQKMGLTVRDAAQVEVSNLEIMDSHLGVWANEESVVHVEDSVFHGSESAGLCAYDHSRVTIRNSVFEANRDDGIFASDRALVSVNNSIAVNNRPYGISVAKQGHIQIDGSYVSGNDEDFSDTGGEAKISVGNNMLGTDPRSAAY